MILASELVKWSDLGKECLIGLAGGVGVVIAWGFVVMGAARYQTARREGREAVAIGGLSLAVIGGLICLGAIVVGIIAMTHKS